MFKGDHILALDIGASSLKMAEFTALKSGGVELVNFGVAPLDLDPQAEGERSAYISTTLREIMQDRGIRPGRVLLSVSGQAVFSRFVKLPPVDRDKVYQIILYEAQQNVPFPIDEVVWDYQLIGGATGELDVMLAAIKADIIEDLTGCVEQAGLETDLVDVAPMALYNAVRYNYNDLPECTLVVDMGARSTDLIFIEKGRVFSRSIPVAGNAITQQIMTEFGMSFADAEALKKAHAFVAFGGAYEGPKSEVVDKVSKSVRSVMTRLHAEINRSVNFYRSQQSGQQPSLILLSGGTAAIPYTDSFLKDKMKVNVDYLNPFLNVAVSEAIETDEVARYAGQMGQVVGLALRRFLTCPIEINLLPPKIQAEKTFRRKQPLFLAAAAALLLTLGVWCAYFVKMSGLAEERMVKVQARVQALEQVETRLREAEGQVAAVQKTVGSLLNLSAKRTQWLEVVDQVHGSMPEGVWLISLKPSTGAASAEPADPNAPPPDPSAASSAAGPVKTLELSGLAYEDKAGSGSTITSFRDKLRQMPLFDPEKTDIIWQPSPAQDDFVRQFKILLVLKSPLNV
ncbi:MAG TPA: type IV pilus assembly protein PilM [Kiritimatiellia bacterium]|nr:type IV pilus assembly protein PilM [Kiritimatiellia bacterium]HSA19345.1 type IV pilus assembly protein PilM [Kiritimatiellia bacterium]